MKKSLGLLLTVMLAACGDKSSDKPANHLTSNDFEQYQGWVNDLPIAALTREKAHSGKYSTTVRPGIDFSLGFSDDLSRVSLSRPKKLKISAWLMIPNAQSHTRFVISLQTPNTPKALFYEGVELEKEIKSYNEWKQVERTVTIPAEAAPNSRLQIYLWRTDTAQPSYMDDVEISLAE